MRSPPACSTLTPEARRACALAWWRHEQQWSNPEPPAATAAPADIDAQVDRYRVQAHYMRHGCWVQQPPLLARCAHVPVRPTLLLQGNEDRICPPDGARALHALLPHARLREVSGVGHDPSHPAMVDAMVRALDAFAAQGSFDATATPHAERDAMSLRLKIQLIVVLLTLLFIAAVLTLQYRAFKESVNEEVVAANRVAAQLLNRTAWVYAAQGTPAMLGFLQGVGRIRSNEVMLFDAAGQELYRSPPSPYKAGRNAPDWFVDVIAPRITEQAIDFPDGKLVVRANASRAALDAWDHFVELVGRRAAAAGDRQRAGVLGGRPRGAAVCADRRRAQAARVGPLRRVAAGARRHRGQHDRRRVQSHGGRARHALETEKRALRAEPQLSDSRELARWVDHHIEQERRMIARELHDELGQSVTAMRSMALSVAQRVRRARCAGRAAARTIADEASRLYDAMHGLIPRLTPLVLDHFGLADALNDLAERTRAGARRRAGRARHRLGRHPTGQRRRAGAVPRRAGGHHQRVAARPGDAA